MADDKKNISDDRKVDKLPEPGKVESAKAAPPVQDQPTPASKEAPKDKDAPAPSKEGTPQGKNEKQTTIPGMGDPAPAGKVVDFTAARDGATKGKQADKAKDAVKPRRGRPPKADKAPPDKAKPQPRDKMSQSKPPAGKGAPVKAEAPAATEQPPAPRDAVRGVKEEIVYLNLAELHPFKNHPFGVRDDAEMQGLVESVKAAGVNQPALVRPREGGGYEIIAGHRRQRASELAGFVNMPCIVRNMTDDEAILAMTDDSAINEQFPIEKFRRVVLAPWAGEVLVRWLDQLRTLGFSDDEIRQMRLSDETPNGAITGPAEIAAHLQPLVKQAGVGDIKVIRTGKNGCSYRETLTLDIQLLGQDARYLAMRCGADTMMLLYFTSRKWEHKTLIQSSNKGESL